MDIKFIVAATRKIPEAGLLLLRDKFELKVSPKARVLKPAELLGFVKGAHAILSQLTYKIDGKVLTRPARSSKS